MYISAICFMVAYCKVLEYGFLHLITSAKLVNLEQYIKEVNQIYRHCSFRVGHFLADNHFNCLWDCASDPGIRLTLVPSEAHVHEI